MTNASRPQQGSSRLLGLLLVAAGAFLNPWSLGQLLADDGQIDQSWIPPLVLAAKAILIVVGLVLALRAPRLPQLLVVPGILACAGVAIASVLGNMKAVQEPAKPAVGQALAANASTPMDKKMGAMGDSKAVCLNEKPMGVVRDSKEACDWLFKNENQFYGPMVLSSEKALVAARTTKDPSQIVLAQMALADHLLRFGRGEEAITLLDEALGLLQDEGVKDQDRVEYNLRRQLGLTWLRVGETNHCLEMHNPKSCLYPIEKEGMWKNPEAAERSAEYFEWCVRKDPTDYGTRWLLNISHMAKGTYPDALGPDLLIDCDSTKNLIEVPHFTDIAHKLGVDAFNLAGGSVMDDIDGDGLLDIVNTTQDPCGQMHYYHNEGGGPFADWTEKAGLKGEVGGLNLFQVDIDGDGRLDLFVPRGAWLLEFGHVLKSLYHQQADGTFRDIAQSAGMTKTAYPCQGAGWDDFDLDGDMDLFVTAEQHPCELFRNNGDLTFTDIAREAGVTNDCYYAKGAAWGDYDGDAYPDLYVSNLGQEEKLFHNNQNGTFTDVALEMGVQAMDTNQGHSLTFTTWFFDYDNDGRLDIYLSGFGASVSDVARDYMGLPTRGERLNLFRNTGDGFINMAGPTGLADVRLPMGANYGDVDNDGWLDIYLGTGKPPFDFLFPNLLYKNVQGKQFVDASAPSGLGHLQKGHGIAFGDLDNDGDQDILSEMGGLYVDDEFFTSLYENPGNDNHWVTIELRGTKTNYFGVGCRVQVDARKPDGTLHTVHLLGGTGGSFGASSLQQEVGLADAVSIEQIVIFWPVSRERQVIQGAPIDSFIRVTEGQAGFELLDRKRFAL